MYEDPKSKISQLEKILDAREDRVTGKVRRHVLHDRDITVNKNWDDSEFKTDKTNYSVRETPKGLSFSSKFLIVSFLFFVVALGIAAYKFLGGENVISVNNIEINVKAPLSVSGGEIMPFEIEIKNNNNVTLTGADLGVAFPLGAKEALDSSIPAKRVQVFLGDILPGQSIKKNLSVALFGIENEKKQIDITLEYKVAGSNSLFNKTKPFSVLINSSPVSIVISAPKEVNTNQSVDFTIEITSNSPTVMKNLLLKADYPFGFAFVSSSPKTFSKNNLWLIGDLEPKAKRIIKFSGVMSGQEGEERGFTFNIGSQSKSDSLTMDTSLTSSFSSVTIRRPFVSADISLNDVSTKEYISKAGTQVEALIKWQNNLLYEVSDVSIIVKINGNAVDKSSVQTEDGFYQSIDNTIIFNKTTNQAFANLSPGAQGISKFTFSSFAADSVTGSGLSNPTVTLDISVTGKRIGYGNDQEDVLFADSRKVKITSDPQLSAKALYYVGPFKNSGPIPPKSEQETTYTITWTITNPLNNLSGVRVSGTLPPYIKWLGVISPDQEKINYDEGTGLVTWNVGSISAGAGSVSPAREVSFQVSFLPSVSQIKTTPDLIGKLTLNAKDNFTLTSVSSDFQALNIDLSNDPSFPLKGETVIQ